MMLLLHLLPALLLSCTGDADDTSDSGTVAEIAGCDAEQPSVVPLSESEIGIGVRDRAADFTLSTLSGELRLSEIWTGCDSLIFGIYYPDDSYASNLWSSSTSKLVTDDPPTDVRYVFMSYTDDAAADVEEMKAQIDDQLSDLDDEERAFWEERFHYVTTPALEIEGWIGEMLAERGPFAFAIDSDQRIREIGLLYKVGGSSGAKLKHLTYEARHLSFERQRRESMEAVEALEIPVFEMQEISDPNWAGESGYAELSLPSAEEMAGYDTLEIDLALYCPDHEDANCPDWDYLVHAYICDVDDPDSCGTEFGRWVSAYHREGRWVHDASPMLSLIAEGGDRRFRFYTQQSYLVDMTFRLSNSGGAVRPQQADYLWSGGTFDETYNDAHEDLTVTVPAEATKVQLFATISGHGWGTDAENCAEFCPHSHHFTVNGVEYTKEHPEAGDSSSCIDAVAIGTTPNQYGTWHYGRGGWCPGMEVPPFVVDVTDAVTPGAEVTLSYEALLDGAVYVPQYTSDGYGPNIQMTSWLVYSW